MTNFIDQDEMRRRLNKCPSDEITAAFEILDAMPVATSLREDLLHATNKELSRDLGLAEDKVKELRTAVRNLAQDFDDLGERCGAAENALAECRQRRERDRDAQIDARMHYLHKCRRCNQELPWTNGTDTEYWCQNCGEEQPATWTEVRWVVEDAP